MRTLPVRLRPQLRSAVLIPWTITRRSQIYSISSWAKSLQCFGLIPLTLSSGVGRDRWSNSVSIVIRKDTVLVAGFDYSSYDSLQEEAPMSCSANLLSGKVIVNGKSKGKVAAGGVKLADFDNETSIFNYCGKN